MSGFKASISHFSCVLVVFFGIHKYVSKEAAILFLCKINTPDHWNAVTGTKIEVKKLEVSVKTIQNVRKRVLMTL